MEIKLLLCTILCRISLSSTALYNTNKNLIGVGKPTDSHNTLRLVFEDKWFVQKLDHFNPTDTRRWKQVPDYIIIIFVNTPTLSSKLYSLFIFPREFFAEISREYKLLSKRRPGVFNGQGRRRNHIRMDEQWSLD